MASPHPSDDVLMARMYEDLRRLAHRMATEHAPIAPTSLVHEAWLKLQGHDAVYADALHVKRVAARAMRQILVDRARARATSKRGGNLERTTLRGVGAAEQTVDLVALAEALEQLEALDVELVEVTELRVFAGFSHAEVALALGFDERTAQRRWRRARAFLVAALGRAGSS